MEFLIEIVHYCCCFCCFVDPLSLYIRVQFDYSFIFSVVLLRHTHTYTDQWLLTSIHMSHIRYLDKQSVKTTYKMPYHWIRMLSRRTQGGSERFLFPSIACARAQTHTQTVNALIMWYNFHIKILLSFGNGMKMIHIRAAKYKDNT